MTDTDPHSVLNDHLANLEKAWNAADGQAYGQEFTSDADFVDIRGTQHTGGDAISGGHQAIYDSIYADSASTTRSPTHASSPPGASPATRPPTSRHPMLPQCHPTTPAAPSSRSPQTTSGRSPPFKTPW